MTDAPETIWAWNTANCDGDWTIAEGQGIEYTRTDISQARIAELEAALRPFARHVDKSSCEITMVWRDGDYVSTYTDTLKPSDFWAATTALKAKP
jgi:methyl coenzyme M reductase subunit C